MKPTEEQINYIGENLPTWGCEYGGECVPAPEVIGKIIELWEKIRSKIMNSKGLCGNLKNYNSNVCRQCTDFDRCIGEPRYSLWMGKIREKR